MSKIIVQGNTVIISSETGLLYHSIGAADFKHIDLSENPSRILDNGKETEKPSGTANNTTRGKKATEKDVTINFVCSAISSDKKLLAVQSPEKVLLVYEVQNWKLIFQRQLGRGASKIIFTPDDSHILVGDKTGDVLLYGLHSEEKETLLLGHLSIILDIIMTDDSKYIITCDRDEKIRVSNYPNCYNIENYCLGHEQFVTNVQLLPHNKKMLISCSGDGTVRLWDYIHGSIRDIYKFDVNIIEPDPVTNESQNQLKCFTSVQLNATTSIVCVSIFKSNTVHVLLVKNESFETGKTINLVHEPVHLQLNSYSPECQKTIQNDYSAKEINLWLVGLNELQVLTWNTADVSFGTVTNPSILNTLDILNSNLKVLAVDEKIENVIYVLQKRKMDEITDYFVRKQARIEEKNVNKGYKK